MNFYSISNEFRPFASPSPYPYRHRTVSHRTHRFLRFLAVKNLKNGRGTVGVRKLSKFVRNTVYEP
jgi:hypothetical protein